MKRVMKTLKQIFLMALVVVGFSLTAMAQKDDKQDRPKKDPPQIVVPDKDRPKPDKPKDDNNNNRPKKPRDESFEN